jgi:hypothetical protein
MGLVFFISMAHNAPQEILHGFVERARTGRSLQGVTMHPQFHLQGLLTSAHGSGINDVAAVAATRGDLGQLAPRKKLLKSFSSFPEDFLRPSEHFGTEGFSFLPPCCPN